MDQRRAETILSREGVWSIENARKPSSGLGTVPDLAGESLQRSPRQLSW